MSIVRKLSTIISILFASQCLAANYALIVGGATISGGTLYDTARVTSSVALGLSDRGDYKVDYLLTGGPSLDHGPYAQELAYVRGVSPPTGPATTQAIDASLERLLKSAKPGDNVEIYINAHGTCLQQGSQCVHHFFIYSETGEIVFYNSNKLMRYVSQLDQRGVHTNLVMESCYSGLLDGQIKRLRNTCSFLLSSAYSEGAGCITDDPPEKKFYTSTAEFIALSYYQNVLPRIREGFYGSTNCFRRVTAHAEKVLDSQKLSSLYDAYWKGLPDDVNPHRPVLSDIPPRLFGIMGEIEPIDNAPLCKPSIENAVSKLADQGMLILKHQYGIEIERYKKLITRQKQLISEMGSEKERFPDRENKAESHLSKIYHQIEKQSQIVIEIERQMEFVANEKYTQPMTDPCKRKI